MSDFTERIDQVLREQFSNCPKPQRDYAAPILAAAAEQHYRRRIETVEELDALPVYALVREDGDAGAVWERLKAWSWLTGPYGSNEVPHPSLPAILLWSPGGER